MKNYIAIFSFIFIFFLQVLGQEANTDESKVKPYVLPELLTSLKGKKITTTCQWEKIRRPEILKLYTEEVFGKVPAKQKISNVIWQEKQGEAFRGKAIRKQFHLIFKRNGKEIGVNVLVYLPKSVEKAPVFIGYNFYGNQTVSDDPKIIIPTTWMRDNPLFKDNKAWENSRGLQKSRWVVEDLINAGYGLVTAYNGDIDPDRDNFNDGIHPLFYKPNQTHPAKNEWGSIGAWAWGLSRILDQLEKMPEIDAKKVIAIGHSRLGKTALWAAASDKRFAGCVSNNSGCMGAALSKRNFGETVEIINKAFPHWFCDNFKKYSGKEDEMNFDQHFLLSLIAPRPVYVASATNDLWADPKGEFLSSKYASPVYELYGKSNLKNAEMPAPEQPIFSTVSYHLRTGDHDITQYDWKEYITFADKFMK